MLVEARGDTLAGGGAPEEATEDVCGVVLRKAAAVDGGEVPGLVEALEVGGASREVVIRESF